MKRKREDSLEEIKGEWFLHKDSLGEIFFQLYLVSERPAKEWRNWRLVSKEINEMVNRIYLKHKRNTCKDLGIFFQAPSVFSQLIIHGKDIANQEFGRELLIEALKHVKCLRELHIRYGKKKSKLLRHQKLVSPGPFAIGDDFGREIAEALMENRSLTRVDIVYNNLGKESGRAFAELLKQNPLLHFINLSYNNIGACGGIAIAEALKQNKSLRNLNLVSNQIGDEGAKAIAEALKQNTSLNQLNLGRNNIGKESAKALIIGLERNDLLNDLQITDNEFDEEGRNNKNGGTK